LNVIAQSPPALPLVPEPSVGFSENKKSYVIHFPWWKGSATTCDRLQGGLTRAKTDGSRKQDLSADKIGKLSSVFNRLNQLTVILAALRPLTFC
jgi:hypothetical protein